MTLKYESELLFDLMKRDGDDAPSDVLPYESELKEKYLNQVVGAYPKLQDYQPEWLNYNLCHHLPSDFPVESVSNVTSASFNHVVPYAYGSAILKGQTLVNIKGEETNEFKLDGRCQNDYILNHVKNNTKYLILYDLTATDTIKIGLIKQTTKDVTWADSTDYITSSNGKVILNSGTDGKFIRIISSEDNTHEIKHLTIIEYQDGMENWNIPYFEGMQSVKMPVLTTTGKNLFDFESFKKEENRIWGSKSYSSFKLNLKPNTKYSWNRFSNDGFGSTCYVLINSVLGSSQGALNWLVHSDSATINKSTGSFNTDNTGVVYISVIINNANQEKTFELLENLIIIESVTHPVSYEPYQSNILHTPEEVVLRSLPNGVCDTLNLKTEEYIQRIGEIVLDGREDGWIHASKYTSNVFELPITNMKYYTEVGQIICDTLPYSYTNMDVWNGYTGVSPLAARGNIVLRNNNTATIQELKEWLSQNPTTLYYELETPIIKTVDLTVTDHDGIAESTIRPIEGTMHVSTSSQTFPPLLEMSVPVEATTQNLMSFANIEGEE